MSEPERTETTSSDPAPSPGTTNEERPSRWTTRLSWAVILLVGYLLGPLPAGLFLGVLPPQVAAPAEKILEVAYSPLSWLYERSERVQEFYDWYKGLLDV